MKRHVIRTKDVSSVRWISKSHSFLLYKPRPFAETAYRLADSDRQAVTRELNEEAIQKMCERFGIQYDPMTGRTKPYWRMAPLPLEIYCYRNNSYIEVDNEYVYNEYVKAICYMLDAGVKVVEDLPLRFTKGIGAIDD